MGVSGCGVLVEGVVVPCNGKTSDDDVFGEAIEELVFPLYLLGDVLNH